MLLLNVFAAFCAAENTDEKNPPCWPEPGVVEPFSRVGVNGTDVIFESLLGPSVADPDLTLRCDIMFPEGDVTTPGFDVAGSDDPRSRVNEKRGLLGSVGVGGVLTIIGAALSPGGGVLGAELVFICWILAVRGRSGEEVTAIGCVDCRSGNMAPILDATLPRPFSPVLSFSFKFKSDPTPPPPALFSRLLLSPDPRLGLRASFNLPTGEGERFGDSSAGALRLFAISAGADSEAARLPVGVGIVDNRCVCELSNCPCEGGSGKVVDCTSGDDVVRYPMCDVCVDSGGGPSRRLRRCLR